MGQQNWRQQHNHCWIYETKLEGSKKVTPSIKEIQNIEKAMAFIEEIIILQSIEHLSVRYKMIVVDGLNPPREKVI